MSKKSKKKQYKDVAFRDGTISVERDLPFPVVYYPGFYGAFLGFSRTSGSEICFCSCAKTAIINYTLLRNVIGPQEYSDPKDSFILSKKVFPISFVQRLLDKNIKNTEAAVNSMVFMDQICHECNRVTPSYSYCVPMYGNVFTQNYGWYINKQSLEYGVMPVSFKILESVCPDEIFSLIDIGKEDFLKTYNQLRETDLVLAQAGDSNFQKYTRRIWKVIENEVRIKFGFKKVGEAWASETLLFQLVSEIFPEEKIVRHYRPDFLDNLELDVFIPNMNIGIEYQGIQHFKPIKHWGGKYALQQVKEREIRGRKLYVKRKAYD